MMKTSIAVLLLALLAALPPAAQAGAGEEEPSFDELLHLNAQALFGGEASFEKDRVVIHYKKPGQFERAFQGPGMVNPASIKGDVNRKILEKPEGGGEIDQIAVVGRGDGNWQSRFELSGNIDLSFKIRFSSLQRGSQFVLRINQTPKSSIQTTFFQNAMLMVGGKVKKRTVAPKEFQLPPEKCFDKKALAPVSISSSDGKFLLKVKREEEKDKAKDKEKAREKAKDKEKEKHKEKEKDREKPKDVELSLDEAGDAAGGKIAFNFAKLSLVIAEMRISGNYDRAWCEEQLKQLDKEKKLVRKAEKPPEEQAPQPPRKAPKKPGEDETARKKDAEEDL